MNRASISRLWLPARPPHLSRTPFLAHAASSKFPEQNAPREQPRQLNTASRRTSQSPRRTQQSPRGPRGPQERVDPQRPQRTTTRAPDASPLLLPRSLIINKEIITRTSGKRLGYIDDVYVDPVSLEVTSLYLRKNVSSLTSLASSGAPRDHVSLSSLRQIGDVVLVHDESSLLDPPADESLGYVRMVGSEVCTEDGVTLGKVRDFLFNPDNGQISSIRYDALGLPSIPQELLGCSRLDERDIVAVGPTKTIVRRGSDRRAIKENEGWVTEYVTSFINLIAGMDIEEQVGEGAMSSEKYRADPAYAAWYERHARDYEMYYGKKLPAPITNAGGRGEQQRGRSQGRPLALPPPQRRSVGQTLQRAPRRTERESRKVEREGSQRMEGQRMEQRRSRMTIDQTPSRQRQLEEQQ